MISASCSFISLSSLEGTEREPPGPPTRCTSASTVLYLCGQVGQEGRKWNRAAGQTRGRTRRRTLRYFGYHLLPS